MGEGFSTKELLIRLMDEVQGMKQTMAETNKALAEFLVTEQNHKEDYQALKKDVHVIREDVDDLKAFKSRVTIYATVGATVVAVIANRLLDYFLT